MHNHYKPDRNCRLLPPYPWKHTEHTYVHVPTTQPADALRVIASACTLVAHLYWVDHFSVPDFELEIDDMLLHPEGPSQDPVPPLLTDEQVIST